MTIDRQGLLRLITWLSPAFPVGAFAYSHGLEMAVHDGWVRSPEALYDWIEDILARGSGWNDAVILAESWHAAHSRDAVRLDEIRDLAEALSPSAERRLETMQMGGAFLEGAKAWNHDAGGRFTGGAPYPVAVGVMAAHMNVGLDETLIAYLHAFGSNLVSAAIRLVPLGQSQGLAVLRKLEAVILAVSARAAVSSLDDLGSATIAVDIASMNHEALHTRLFRS